MFDGSKILIVFLVVGMLWSSPRYQRMSRDLDKSAFAALKRIMYMAEESGYPAEVVPFLLVLTALMYTLSGYLTAAYVR
jgi:hypothetical protein